MKSIPLQEAVGMIPNGACLMIGGFMACGTPEPMIDALVRQGRRELTVIANDTGLPGVGIGKLVAARLVRKAIVSHIGLNPETQRQMIEGEMTVELVPQRTLIERLRAAGAGLGGVLTTTGLGTVVAEGKRKVALDGRDYLIESALHADFALVNAFLCDYLGNLTYALTARSFNPVIATAADKVVVFAEPIVPVGVSPRCLRPPRASRSIRCVPPRRRNCASPNRCHKWRSSPAVSQLHRSHRR
jgi:acetate CoA/acetoacetate CoA-transferase alpha subunit